MPSFDEKLKTLLKTENSFVDQDGDLLEGKLQDAARNADGKLIKLLITDEEMRNKFFSEIAGYQVFNGNLFIEYIGNKNFLDNSYTKFKNKIGLQSGGKFLKESGDISLVWPFKDCVLEGGQTKEDEVKKEIFFNEILAQDEIDKLFAPKVLTNFKKYDKDGEHKVEGFNKDEEGHLKDNLIIKGNNLLALHTLKKEFKGRVKCIYIDIPYNTGSDSFGYNDKFNHSTWLTFMKNRVEVAKTFLTNDGIICLQCDDNEQAYLKILMDEIFLRENFVNCISVEMSNMSGQKVNNAINGKKFPKLKEYILIYAVDKGYINLSIPKIAKDERDKEYNKIIPDRSMDDFEIFNSNNEDLCKKIEKYHIYSLADRAKENNIELTDEWKKENSYRIFATKPNAALLKKVKDMNFKNDIAIIQNASGDNKLIITEFNRDTETARLELASAYLNSSSFLGDSWTDISTIGGVAQEGGVVLKNGKKPEKLLQRIIDTTSKKGDIVMDYHLGSGTTAAVAHKMGRQYIGIEQLDYGENDSVIRLNNVISGDQTGISKSINRQGGGEFIYCELKKYNQEFIEQIEDAKSTDNLLNVRERMKEKAYFKYNFDMQKFEESLEEFKDKPLEEQKTVLIEILNKNQLYVNLSDIDDEDFQVSEEDKKLNDLFYNN